MVQTDLKVDLKIQNKEKSEKQRNIKALIKFYFLPGFRVPEFSEKEYEIGKKRSKRKLFRRLITPLTLLGFAMILLIVFIGIFAPWLSIYTIEEVALPHIPPLSSPFDDPSPLHLLGTTKYGYDILGRLIWGARTVITAAAFPVLISNLGGIVLGTLSAYFGGKLDYIMMRIVDFMYSFPIIIIVIIIAPMMGGKLYNILLLWGILYIPYTTRFVRSLTLQVKQSLYVEAAITGGADKLKVMFKHVFPNTYSALIISFFGSMAFSVLGFASIAFLGMGDQSFADWGTDIAYSRSNLTAIGPAFWPGLFIGITTIGFILVGDGLRDALDPRLKR
ncbi:MAG: ABC transporter permease [Candidatus Lokiarchaeota archaeon]|nr:ABC transporter permease [Candidatus Lokiarchaeota archaeon]